MACISSKTQGPGEQGATGYSPKILLLKRAKMVLCPFHRIETFRRSYRDPPAGPTPLAPTQLNQVEIGSKSGPNQSGRRGSAGSVPEGRSGWEGPCSSSESSYHRNHRGICTRNRPVSETKFLLMISGAPFSPGHFVLLLTAGDAPEQFKSQYVYTISFS